MLINCTRLGGNKRDNSNDKIYASIYAFATTTSDFRSCEIKDMKDHKNDDATLARTNLVKF